MFKFAVACSTALALRVHSKCIDDLNLLSYKFLGNIGKEKCTAVKHAPHFNHICGEAVHFDEMTIGAIDGLATYIHTYILIAA